MRSEYFAIAAIVIFACGDPAPTQPVPQPFEVPAEAVNWLQQHAMSFDGASPALGNTDLEVLRTVVGTARVVSLGEATHGTREFFQMKHRVLKFLVEEMDFNIFGIEATWPEVNRINEYVLNGTGDPAVVLSGQYFWTWNTEEVFAMMEWMRAHNAGAGAARPVSFLGFDMQYPGMAIHNVETYVASLNVDLGLYMTDQFSCMTIYANNPQGAFPTERYGSQIQEYRDDCRQALNSVVDSLLVHQSEFEAATSPKDFAMALQSAQITVQFENMESQRLSSARDKHMADNSIWLLEQGGPNAKIVLWAHNFHVSEAPGAQGTFLRAHFGSEMVIVGFTFDRGSFTAVTQSPSGSFVSLDRHTVDQAPDASYEHYFRSAGMSPFILDMRDISFSGPESAWLAGPRATRQLGCCYQPSSPDRYISMQRFPDEYDVMIFFEVTSASVVRPFTYPTEW